VQKLEHLWPVARGDPEVNLLSCLRVLRIRRGIGEEAGFLNQSLVCFGKLLFLKEVGNKVQCFIELHYTWLKL